jgi:3-hydroxyisobutyrate dehydrogenase
MNIHWIGLGSIGSIMALNLVKAGYSLVVCDLKPDSAKECTAEGATWTADPCELAKAADIVITSLPGPSEVASIMEGESNLLSCLRPGCTWVEMSTTDTNEVKRLGKIAASKGIEMLEAPVTGGLVLARKGGITILIGGKKDVFEAHLPLLQAIGGRIIRTGPLGSANVVKVISNLLALGHMILAGEAFMLGKKAGIELDCLFESIMSSSGQSRTIRNEMPLVFNGSYDVGFSMALACKDLRLVLDLANKYEMPLELGGLIEQIFIRAKKHYGRKANSTQVVKLLEDTMQQELRADVKPYAPLDKYDF